MTGKRLDRNTPRTCLKCGKTKPLSEFCPGVSFIATPQRYCNNCLDAVSYQKKVDRPHIVVTEKICSKCGETKPASEFGKKKETLDGLSSSCKECRNKHVRARYGEHPEQHAEAYARLSSRLHVEVTEKTCSDCGETRPISEFRKEKAALDGRGVYCKKCRNVRERTYYQEHREEKVAQSQTWRLAHRDTVLEKNRRYYAEHPEKNVERKARYAAKYPERVAEQRKRSVALWRIRYPERYRAMKAESRNRRRRAIGTASERLPQSDYQEIRERSAGWCPYCCEPLEGEPCSYDHHFPVSKGGLNDKGNMVYCHLSCNITKSTKVGAAYAKWLRERADVVKAMGAGV